jgi:hypothetical protein
VLLFLFKQISNPLKNFQIFMLGKDLELNSYLALGLHSKNGLIVKTWVHHLVHALCWLDFHFKNDFLAPWSISITNHQMLLAKSKILRNLMSLW